ncbi:MAG: terminase, partial [Chloroflexia bacterium]|nr:terminase [Chloroflexia bacterium]
GSVTTAMAVRLEREIATLAGRLVRYESPSALDLARMAGIDPDPWQQDVLQSRSRRVLLNCCRQSGKSTITAIVAVDTALSVPRSLVLLVSPTLRQSGELFRKALAVYRAADRPIPADAETALSLSLSNGSRIVSLPGKEATVRGYSGAALIAIDEASRVPNDLYLSLRPMLAVSGGRLIALSTPFGTRGWWYEAWRSREAWERVRITAAQVDRIPAAFLEEERRTLGPWWYAQEYEGEFMDAQSQIFTRAEIDHAFVEEVATWTL